MQKIGKEIKNNKYFAEIKITLLLVSWYLLIKINRSFDYENPDIRNSINSIWKQESVYSDMGMKSIPMELTTYLDETNEIVKVLSEEGIDPTSLTSLRGLFVANDYFDQEIGNMLEFSDDITTYDSLVIEIDNVLNKFTSKIEETESISFDIIQIKKYYDDDHQDSIHQFLSNNFICILLNWFQGKYSDDSVKSFIARTNNNREVHQNAPFDFSHEINR